MSEGVEKKGDRPYSDRGDRKPFPRKDTFYGDEKIVVKVVKEAAAEKESLMKGVVKENLFGDGRPRMTENRSEGMEKKANALFQEVVRMLTEPNASLFQAGLKENHTQRKIPMEIKRTIVLTVKKETVLPIQNAVKENPIHAIRIPGIKINFLLKEQQALTVVKERGHLAILRKVMPVILNARM